MLTSTALQPVYGRLSDIFGRKSVLLGSLIIFLFGSLACALAQTMIQLIIFRAIQGLGGGGILTLAMIISELNLPLPSEPDVADTRSCPRATFDSRLSVYATRADPHRDRKSVV